MRYFPLIRRSHEPFWTALDIEKAFDELLSSPFKAGVAVPAVDVYEKGNTVIAKAEIPGVTPEDIKLSVEGNLLTITGEKKYENETKKEDYHRIESSYGEFRRVVELPSDVKANEAKASYKNGVLKIELPKAETTKNKEIKIDVK